MTEELYSQFNGVFVAPTVSLLGEACSNYLTEMKAGEARIDDAEASLRLAIENCIKCLNLKSDFRKENG
jgi:predicted hydrocarbon binding protein